MAAGEGTLEFVLRYLALYYSAPDGLRILVPADGHRAILRDRISGVTIPLNEASVSLEVDGQPAAGAHTRIVPDERLLVVENVLKITNPVAPESEFLATNPVHESLNALVSLPGGTLRAFLPEAFPDRDDPVEIVLGENNKIVTRITDTTVWGVELPKGHRCELVVKTPRTYVRIDVSTGARFELRNEEEIRGPVPDRIKYHSDELKSLLKFLGGSSRVQCDQYACGFLLCGEGPL